MPIPRSKIAGRPYRFSWSLLHPSRRIISSQPVGWVERLRNPSACSACVVTRWVSRSLSSGAHSRDPLAPPILRIQIYFRLPPIELPFQCESNSQRDLVMSDRPIFDMASRLHDFEPFHLANGL